MSDEKRLQELGEGALRLRKEIARAVVGQEQVIEELLVAVLTGGHALLVGVPGLAKTLLVSSLARCLDLSFGRVQFTPDLLPADITGTDVLQEVERDGRIRHETQFLPGPIFANVILADEINRTPPKTQAALLQAMQERHVTVGGATHPLPDPFQVFATRNPIEQEGTFPLPEAQLDRFLLEIRVGYPNESEEREIARRTSSGEAAQVGKILTREEVQAFSQLIARVPVADEALALAVTLARRSRPEEPEASTMVKDYVRFGAGPRGSGALVLAAKGLAALRGQAVCDLGEIRAVAHAALRHRLVLSYRAEADGVSADEVVESLLKKA